MDQPLEAGQPAPGFSLAAAGTHDGGDTVSLEQFKGRKLVIFFYPKDNTPGCTKEAVGFSSLREAFLAADTDVIGISADTVKKHENFIAKHDLNVPLGADTELEALKAYGVWAEKSMYGRKYMGIVRSTFLIDRDGKIAQIWSKVKVKDHAETVLQAAQSL